MSTVTILIVLSGLVIFSYLFDIIAKRTRFPSVLLLLFLGMLLNLLSSLLNITIIDFKQVLPALGTVGLILIVLEGSLELKYNPEKKAVIRSAFFSAFFNLVITSVGIGIILYFVNGQPFNICLLNAIPFGVISSSIAIPSVAHIQEDKREFIIYESSFSDILGIIFFNFGLNNLKTTFSSFIYLGFDVALIVLISAIFSLFLLYLIGRINHNIKFFLILSIIILVYAIGEYFHLSSLIIVLTFGLFINNADKINHEGFRKLLIYDKLKADLNQLFQLSAESAFLFRTFFFIIFGYSIYINSISNAGTLIYAALVLILIYLIRFIYIKVILRKELIPSLFITPRGLISILLFYNIPEVYKIKGLESAMLFIIIIVTSTLMSIGLILTQGKSTDKQPGTYDTFD